MMKLWILLLLVNAGISFAKDAPIELNLAYPAEGTILNAQLGLIFEHTPILENHGFKAKVSAMGTGKELKTALVSGRADVIFTTETNFIVLLGNGFDAYAINSLGSAGRLALVVREDSPIKSIGELKDKKIGTIFGTSIHQPALEWAKQAGAQVLDFGSLAAMESSLAVGTLDAFITWDPFLESALLSHRERILKQDEFYLVSIASKSFRDRPGAVRNLNEAIADALVYYSTHRSEVNGWFAARSHLDALSIDNATKINQNYQVIKSNDVNLKLSPTLAARFKSEGDFFSNNHLIAKPISDLSSHMDNP